MAEETKAQIQEKLEAALAEGATLKEAVESITAENEELRNRIVVLEDGAGDSEALKAAADQITELNGIVEEQAAEIASLTEQCEKLGKRGPTAAERAKAREEAAAKKAEAMAKQNAESIDRVKIEKEGRVREVAKVDLKTFEADGWEAV